MYRCDLGFFSLRRILQDRWITQALEVQARQQADGRAVNTSGTVALTPCSSDGGTNTFTCGFGGSDCSKNSDTFTMAGAVGLSLRTNQVAQLLSAALPSSTDGGLAATVTAYVTSTAALGAAGSFTGGQVAGLAIGIAVPLIAGLLAFFALWRREKKLNAPPKLMYKLPDDLKDEFTWRPPQSTRPASPSFGLSVGPRSPGSSTPASSTFADRQNSFRSFASPKPDRMHNFQERYDNMRSKTSLPERHELAVKIVDIPRQDLGSGRRPRQ